jgi:hypothetical protein
MLSKFSLAQIGLTTVIRICLRAFPVSLLDLITGHKATSTLKGISLSVGAKRRDRNQIRRCFVKPKKEAIIGSPNPEPLRVHKDLHFRRKTYIWFHSPQHLGPLIFSFMGSSGNPLNQSLLNSFVKDHFPIFKDAEQKEFVGLLLGPSLIHLFGATFE